MYNEFPGLDVALWWGSVVSLSHLAKLANLTKVLLRGLNGAGSIAKIGDFGILFWRWCPVPSGQRPWDQGGAGAPRCAHLQRWYAEEGILAGSLECVPPVSKLAEPRSTFHMISGIQKFPWVSEPTFGASGALCNQTEVSCFLLNYRVFALPGSSDVLFCCFLKSLAFKWLLQSETWSTYILFKKDIIFISRLMMYSLPAKSSNYFWGRTLLPCVSSWLIFGKSLWNLFAKPRTIANRCDAASPCCVGSRYIMGI